MVELPCVHGKTDSDSIHVDKSDAVEGNMHKIHMIFIRKESRGQRTVKEKKEEKEEGYMCIDRMKKKNRILNKEREL